MINLTYKDVLRVAEQVVADVPEDFRYQKRPGPNSYLYVHEGKPDCIVGNILVRMGVQPEVFAEYEGVGAYSLLGWLEHDGVIKGCEMKVREFLSCFQRRQDNGNTWAGSLEDAKAYMHRIYSQ